MERRGVAPDGRLLSAAVANLLEERLRFLQIARVKPLSEPAVNRSQQFARLLHLALVAPETCEAHGSVGQIWRRSLSVNATIMRSPALLTNSSVSSFSLAILCHPREQYCSEMH